MADLTLNGIKVEDTFAEAFDVAGTAIIVTNDTPKWAMIAATVMTGFATSVIGCGAEAGIDAELSPDETPDGRPGVRILLFGHGPGKEILPQVADAPEGLGVVLTVVADRRQIGQADGKSI